MMRGDQILLALDLLHYINLLHHYCIEGGDCWIRGTPNEEVPTEYNPRKFSREKVVQRLRLFDFRFDPWEGLIPDQNCAGICEEEWVRLEGIRNFLHANEAALSVLTLNIEGMVSPEMERAELFRSIISGGLTEEMLK